jgi:serine phosphatase RsbU (regulator of sigma subunit)
MLMKYNILLTFIVVSVFTYPKSVIVLDEQMQSDINIPDYVYVLEDPTGQLSIEQVILSKEDQDFRVNTSQYLNFGFTNSAYWIKFSIINKQEKTQDLVLAIQNPLLPNIDFYSIRNNVLEKQISTGENRPFASREIENRNFLFDIELNPNVRYDYYVRVSSNGGPLQIPITIDEYQHFLDSDNDALILNGLLIGMFVFVIIFNLFLLLINKNGYNIYYTIYVALLTLFLLCVSGVNYQYIWPESVWMQKHFLLISAGLANVFLIMFAQNFFNFKRYFWRLNKLAKLLIVGILILTVFSLFDGGLYNVSKLLINTASLITIIFLTATSIRGLTKKNKMHYYFVFSFGIFLIGVGTYVFHNVGLLNNYHVAIWAMQLGFLIEVILLMFAVIHQFRLVEKQTNIELESIVSERTKELEDQKEELLVQKTEIIYQRDKILGQHRRAVKQSRVISDKNKEISDSMAYAKVIQNAVLTPKSRLDKALKQYYILNQPKDVIGGDFFWFHEKENRSYIAVADCTGHGIPGAMLSMLGVAALNEIVLKEDYLGPAEILNRLSKVVEKSLHQTGNFGDSKDGMDISMCMIDNMTNTMLTSGSNNPVYIYRESDNIECTDYINCYEFEDNRLMTILPDKLSIGYNEEPSSAFVDKKVNLLADDMVYLFSDGFVDQFGGVDGKKYKRNRFRKLLSENASITDPQTQRQHVIKHLDSWKQEYEQVDDIMIFGVRV